MIDLSPIWIAQTTELKLVLRAGEQYGFPSRVRGLRIPRWMIANMGGNRGSMITGSLVHNHRIERLWRDFNQVMVWSYRNLFYYLEKQRVLDPLDSVHLFCLHQLYIPRINHTLSEFTDQINNHPIRTENNQSPCQLFVQWHIERCSSKGVHWTELHAQCVKVVDHAYFCPKTKHDIRDICTRDWKPRAPPIKC